MLIDIAILATKALHLKMETIGKLIMEGDGAAAKRVIRSARADLTEVDNMVSRISAQLGESPKHGDSMAILRKALDGYEKLVDAHLPLPS